MQPQSTKELILKNTQFKESVNLTSFLDFIDYKNEPADISIKKLIKQADKNCEFLSTRVNLVALSEHSKLQDTLKFIYLVKKMLTEIEVSKEGNYKKL